MTANGALAVTAVFDLAATTLTVVKSGNGGGLVTTNPSGISCGTTCSASFPSGTSVTLVTSADVGSVFAGWSGGGCSGTGPCTTMLSTATTVTATFSIRGFAVNVVSFGAGMGTVQSSPVGITCGSDCSETWNPGTAVVLTATPLTGSTFAGWSGGGCSGTGTCTFVVNAATTITATFNSSGVFRIGHTTPLGATSMAGPNFLLGEQIAIPSAVTLRQFGVIALGAGPLMQMALYTNAGGAPGTLVASTASTAALPLSPVPPC